MPPASNGKHDGRRVPSPAELAELPRAGLWRRMAALFYDMFLIAGIWICLGFILQWLFGTDANQVVDGTVETDPLLRRSMLAMMLLTATGFYVGFWHFSGQTLGMIAWRIRVVDLDNRPLSPGRCLIRFLAAWPAFWLFGTGYLWRYLDPRGDAVHERLSGSKTVLLPKHARPF